MKLFIFPWNERSQGAKALSAGLDASRIRLSNSSFVGHHDKTVINWGASEVSPEVRKCRVINTERAVDISCDKKKFFECMSSARNGPRIPEYTTNVEVAADWARSKTLVVARTKLRSRAGSDIVFFDNLDKFLEAKLYTKYIKKKEEYRVHIFRGDVIAVQQKVLRKFDDSNKEIDPATVDFRIRNHNNGFVFQRHGLHTPPDVLAQSLRAMTASGLDFGAVDVIWNESQGMAYVLEINTAPGLEGETVNDYIGAFKRL